MIQPVSTPEADQRAPGPPCLWASGQELGSARPRPEQGEREGDQGEERGDVRAVLGSAWR